MTKRRFIPWLGILLAALLTLPAAAAEKDQDKLAGPPDKKEAQDDGQEIVVKGVQRLRVKVEKPEPDLIFDVDEIAVPYVKTEDSVLDVSPTSMTDPSISVPRLLNSTQAASPHILLFKQPPILTLNPRYKSKVRIAKWRLRITDSFGNVFRDFSGKGSLPKQIIWDGLGKTKAMLDVGTSYSYIFSVIDVASNPTSQMGKPIVLESLMYDDNGTTIAQVVMDAIFTKKARKTVISDKGQLYLREVADMLTTHQKFPLVMEAYSKDVDDARYKGELVQDYLKERLTLRKKDIKIVARKSRIKRLVFKIR